jgi:small subunit ribosomal protein S20
MANIASQKKRIARTERERQENLRFGGATKTYMKQLEKAMAAGDESAADEAHKRLITSVDKAIQKGAMHKNTGARKKARAARIRSGSTPVPSPARAQQPAAAAEEAPAAPEAEADEAPAEAEEKQD